LSKNTRALITGIGLVSSLGIGVDAHRKKLSQGSIIPITEMIEGVSYPVHPLCNIDYEQQIPRRGDRRQMGDWQLLGTFAAGLALEDAGLAADDDAKSRTHLLVAAGIGVRDQESDQAIINQVVNLPNDGPLLNQLLMDTLRPTLFLTQLANLLAGNISIVHGVTGSSSSLMGAEMAGVSVVENAVNRIQSGDADLFLVGGSFVASPDHLLSLIAMKLAWKGEFLPISQREAKGGGALFGSVGAFLLIESSAHAEARGATAYAAIREVNSGNGVNRSIREVVKRLMGTVATDRLLVMSGATGIEPQTSEEKLVLEYLGIAVKDLQVRSYSNILGLSSEAHFPAGVALAAIAAHHAEPYVPFDISEFEHPTNEVADQMLVTTSGQWRGAGAALLDRIE